MSSLSNFFSFLKSGSSSDELPNIFPLSTTESAFVQTDVEAIYARILTDVLERTQGIPDEKQKLLWDNCIASEKSTGLVSLVAKAMTAKSKLFIVYDPATEVLREATSSEAAQIEADYLKQAKSTAGVFISFKDYKRTDMLKLYSALEYADVAALYKSMNLSKAVQLKLKELRSSVALTDKVEAVSQAKAIAKGLSEGKDVMLDAGDVIETAKPDLTATNAAMEFIDRKRSFYLGLPASWITGASTKSMSDTGESDAKAVERGLRGYYFAIVKPVVEAVLDVKTTFKTEDFRNAAGALEALKTFELTSDELLSSDNKREIINKLFGLPQGEKGGARDVTPPKETAALPPPKPAAAQGG